MKKNVLILVVAFLFLSFSDPKPKILVIGDSISIGYFPFVNTELSDMAVLYHNEGNARYTKYGLENIHQWLGDTHWDIIQFNWGLWDLAHRKIKGSDKRKLTTSLQQYERNLDSLVHILKQTGAQLIFVTTSFVPKHSPGRKYKDPKRYNKVAIKVMKRNGVMINDIYKISKKIHSKFGKSKNNVHYTQEGYEKLSYSISDFLKKALDSSDE